jgi:hypothetical protein
MNQQVKEAVRMIGHLLETNGTVGASGRNSSGQPIGYGEPKTCKWCLVGATLVVTDKLTTVSYEEARSAITRLVGDGLVDAWEPRRNGKDARKKIVEKLKNA